MMQGDSVYQTIALYAIAISCMIITIYGDDLMSNVFWSSVG